MGTKAAGPDTGLWGWVGRAGHRGYGSPRPDPSRRKRGQAGVWGAGWGRGRGAGAAQCVPRPGSTPSPRALPTGQSHARCGGRVAPLESHGGGGGGRLSHPEQRLAWLTVYSLNRLQNVLGAPRGPQVLAWQGREEKVRSLAFLKQTMPRTRPCQPDVGGCVPPTWWPISTDRFSRRAYRLEILLDLTGRGQSVGGPVFPAGGSRGESVPLPLPAPGDARAPGLGVSSSICKASSTGPSPQMPLGSFEFCASLFPLKTAGITEPSWIIPDNLPLFKSATGNRHSVGHLTSPSSPMRMQCPVCRDKTRCVQGPALPEGRRERGEPQPLRRPTLSSVQFGETVLLSDVKHFALCLAALPLGACRATSPGATLSPRPPSSMRFPVVEATYVVGYGPQATESLDSIYSQLSEPCSVHPPCVHTCGICSVLPSCPGLGIPA